MKNLSLLILLLYAITGGFAQSLSISGTVSAAASPQSEVLIDVYEYNSPIQTLLTDSKGDFTFELTKGKEYVVTIYKSGYVLQSFSISVDKTDKLQAYTLDVDLNVDTHSPDGLFFKNPLKRISTDADAKGLHESKYDQKLIIPQQRADSVLVLLNRAQANQYILVSKMKINLKGTDDKYSRQIEENVRTEMNNYSTKMTQSNVRYDSIKVLEDAHVAATQTTKDDVQYDHLLLAQKNLAERLEERANYFLLLQQKQLAKARLLELQSIKMDQQVNEATDSVAKEEFKRNYWKLKAEATNARYLAMDANNKFLSYNNYQMVNYQEYIELLRYRGKRKDEVKTAAKAPAKPESDTRATITARDTSDNLSKLSDDKRRQVIQAALEEEERFKNYESKTVKKKVDGVELTVQQIRIADDQYEMQVDRKGAARYYKNGKPVTQLTFEFETKRKMMDVLQTIREVEKFGK